MGYSVRNRSSPEYIPAVVAKARMVLRRNELMKEMEEARRRMYSFMRQGPQYRDNTFLTEVDEEEEEEDHLDVAVKNHQVSTGARLRNAGRSTPHVHAILSDTGQT